MSYTHAVTTIRQDMTTNITCVLGTTNYPIISIHHKNKNNGETGRNYFGREETINLKSIQKENTNISYTHAGTNIKPCMITNTTCVLGTTDYLIISIHNKNKNNGEIVRNNYGREETTNFKSIEKETTNMSYTHAATTIKPCMVTNLTCVLGTTDYLIP